MDPKDPAKAIAGALRAVGEAVDEAGEDAAWRLDLPCVPVHSQIGASGFCLVSKIMREEIAG